MKVEGCEFLRTRPTERAAEFARQPRRLLQSPTAVRRTESSRIGSVVMKKLRVVYGIVNTEDPGVHIGSTEDYFRREAENHRALQRGCHPNPDLQAECSGIDGAQWRSVILEEVPVHVRLETREDCWRRLALIPITIDGKVLHCCLNPLGRRRRRDDPIP